MATNINPIPRDIADRAVHEYLTGQKTENQLAHENGITVPLTASVQSYSCLRNWRPPISAVIIVIMTGK